MVYAGILAAGLGVRMHRQDLPKPFLMLGKKPIIVHTMEQFFVNPRIDKIIVVTPGTWSVYAQDLLSKYDNMGKPVEIITGGVNKTESIMMIAEHIAQSSLGEDDILVAHDAIRPFITQRIIDDNIDAALCYGAANTVMETNDTIVVSNDGLTLTDVPPKRIMLAEQTPLSVKIKLLRDVANRVIEQNIALYNEYELARVFMRLDIPMRLVRGEYSNMKIINPYDLEVANALLLERKK
jgi:2-C-methyl-D-erythritol 4-phosphate cytidylyltransferase